MKLTPVDKGNIAFPHEIREIIRHADLYDSSSSPEARVYLAKDRCFIKRAAAGSLKREADMYSYFHKKGLSPEVLSYLTDGDCDWLITAIAKGDDCTAKKYLSNPKRLCDTTAAALRALHETDFLDCPVQSRTQEYLDTAEQGYKRGIFSPELFSGSFKISSPEEAYKLLCEMKAEFRSDTLIHGDYCLPNIMLDGWRPTAFIDIGNGGVGDRHIDIFWGVWTLFFNLGTEKYTERFIDAYGKDAIIPDMLKAVAAAEVFA